MVSCNLWILFAFLVIVMDKPVSSAERQRKDVTIVSKSTTNEAKLSRKEQVNELTITGDPSELNAIAAYLSSSFNELKTYDRTVCEHETLRMNCLAGRSIQITDAFYGRNTEEICDEDPNKTSSLNCHSPPQTKAEVEKICNHRESCSVSASNNVFTDPCFGIYKYLQVSYKCLSEPLHLVTACDGDGVNIFCPQGEFIKVNSATYGKTRPTVCNRQGIRTNTLTCQADSERVTQIAIQRCDGKSSCAIHTINDVVAVVGDPCFGIVKHLDVNYKCL